MLTRPLQGGGEGGQLRTVSLIINTIRPHAIEKSVRIPSVYFPLLGAKKSLVLKNKFSFEKKLSFEWGVQEKVPQAANCARELI